MISVPEVTIRGGNVIAFPSGKRVQETESVKEAVIAALQEDRVGLHYQPQYSLITGEMVGAEALVRLRNSNDQLMDAAVVVETAEREQLIDWLGHSVLRSACREYAALKQQGLRLNRLAVNVSPLELRQTDYAEEVAASIVAAGLAYEDIELEITESASLADPTLILEHLHALADLGIRLAIDDFGSGHTAWSHVVALPVSTLKIDRRLASQVTESNKAAVIVRNICATAAELGMEVVGEGVTSQAQQSLLRQLGCNLGQGFGLARPMPAADLGELPLVAHL